MGREGLFGHATTVLIHGGFLFGLERSIINCFDFTTQTTSKSETDPPGANYLQVLSMAIIVAILQPMKSPGVGLTLEWSQLAYFCLLGVGFTFVSGLCGKIKTTDNAPFQPK